MRKFKKILSLILALIMVFTLVPSNVQNVDATNSSDFLKIFQLDAGRKYFSVSEIEGIIDQLSDNGFDALGLVVGNDSLRFLLDDMSVGNHKSDDVKDAIKSGNSTKSKGELSQNDMDTIISYAKEKHIQIIPLINTPGHMDAIISAMETLNITTTTGKNMDVSNASECTFVKELLQKYIDYFADKGSTYFNIGADEYNFSDLTSEKYGKFVEYINDIASLVLNKNMKPIAFNDGIYYKSNDNDFLSIADTINKEIIITYWAQADNYASVSELHAKGFKLLNNNNAWYYVLGDALYDKWSSGQWGYNDSKKGLQNTPCDQFNNTSDVSAIGSVLCVWCDYPEYEYESEKVYDLIATMASSNPNYFAVNNENDVIEKQIYVSVGSKTTETITGANYSGTSYSTDDSSIATVDVTGDNGSEAKTEYTEQTNISCTNLISSNRNTWQETDYYYYSSNKDNYYKVYAKKSGNGNRYTYTWGYSESGSSNDVTQITTQQTNNVNSSPNITVYKKIDREAVPVSTTITFTGKKEGSTYVIIGNTKYIINVISEELSNVSPLPIQLWITNNPINVTDVTSNTSGTYRWNNYGNEKAYYVNVSASNAYGENGTELTSLVPTGILQNSAQTSSDDVKAKYVIWKGTVLDRNSNESDYYGLQYIWTDNKSYSGSDFNYVRYYNGAWAVSSDRNTWTTVTGQGSTGNVSNCQQQIIAYYMQRTEITEQVITDTVDYGDILSEQTSSNGNINNGNYVVLDYAVKYPTGLQVPETFRQSGKTLLYHCEGGGDTGTKGEYRRLNAIRATETSSYEVYMITITPTTDSTIDKTFDTGSVPENYRYSGTERVIWAESQDVIPDGYSTIEDLSQDNKNYGEVTYGGKPEISELNIYNRQGMLITYYIRGKQTNDALQVQYVDDTSGETFYTTNIPVINEGDEVRTFNNGLFDRDDKLYNVSSTTTLDDNKYYVVDSYNTHVYVRSDLTKIVDLHGVYTTGIYKHVKAEIDPKNPKILVLHYVADRTIGNYKNFVVDFGLPVEVSLDDLFENTSDISNISKVSDGNYGNVTINSNKNEFTYTPSMVLRNTDVITIKVTFKDDTTENYKIGFVPATTVYYEEGFANYTGSWTNSGSKGNSTQATQIAGESTDEYGYDKKYTDENGKSNNTEISSSKKGENSVFEFTGTGVDVYANCSRNTGKATILVSNSDTGKAVKLVTVNTSTNSDIYKDYSGEEENSLPILSITDLENGNYTVKVIVTSGTINIDGFRVYGTLSNEPDFYKTDNEDNPTYLELRDYVLTAMNVDNQSSAEVYAQIRNQTDNQLSAGPVVLNENSAYEAKSLLENGPKNELFLLPGESVIFNIDTNREVQVGLKAPVGNVKYTINNKEESMTTSTDMFYTVLNKTSGDSISQTVTIKNTDDSGILSVTKVKICDDPDAIFGELTEEDIAIALGEKTAPVYADARLTVKVNDKTTVLTTNGVVGETNTFKASEIQEAAESLVADGYTLNDVKFSDVSVAYGEEGSVEFSATKEKKSNSVLDKIVNFFKGLFKR